jgi:hypothetical protein
VMAQSMPVGCWWIWRMPSKRVSSRRAPAGWPRPVGRRSRSRVRQVSGLCDIYSHFGQILSFNLTLVCA